MLPVLSKAVSALELQGIHFSVQYKRQSLADMR
jgi:hypothetical protein